jgi:Flp pilus assembly pilin Flp
MNTLASFPARARIAIQLRLLQWGDPESGQGMVEYAFIVVMIALVVILTVVIIGNQTRNMWQDINNSFSKSG